MEYEFVVSQDPKTGEDIATWRELRAKSRNGATMALARQILDADSQAEDGEVRVVDQAGRLRFTANSLHRLAGITIDATGRFRAFRPFSGDRLADGATA